MADDVKYDVAIVGGGLAGLVSAIVLSARGARVLLLEKKTYPTHKVCGEYVSNEVLGYLKSLGFDPFVFGAAKIERLRISTPSGKNIYTDLDLGAFALSRHTMDHELAKLAIQKGTDLRTDTTVSEIVFSDNSFVVSTKEGNFYSAAFVIGSWGKRDTLDKKLHRPFMDNHTRYMGVKYHIRTDYPVNEIGLDNFDGGYCGIVKIEGDKYNLCNFYRRPEDLRKHSSVAEYEEDVVFKNPRIRHLFKNSEFLFDAPVVINEINFDAKKPVEDHILMCGDSAGLITPLCGNGMSIAITGAKLLTDILLKYSSDRKMHLSKTDRSAIEREWIQTWSKNFKSRLLIGRSVQKIFGSTLVTEVAVRLLHAIPPLERAIIKATHGNSLT